MLLLTNRCPRSLYAQKRRDASSRQGIKMQNQSRILPWILRSAAFTALLLAPLATAQSRPAQGAPQPRSAATAQQPLMAEPIPTERDLAATQKELIRLLRLSPKLTTVVAHDPSLLANQDYVSRNNPELAQFLAAHPEIVRNPEFYLFTHAHPGDGGPDEALERAVWPEYVQSHGERTVDVVGPITAAVAFACFLGALIWLIRVILENRRWGRIFKLQSEVHGRLIDKFSSNQELALYMGTEAGRKFLEAAPIPVGFEPEQRVPNVVARVLTPLQIGIVLSLLGVGFYLLRHASPDTRTPMLILGTIALMPGLGFIISAGVTWILAARLGLMPDSPSALNTPGNSPYDTQDRQ
jgi:hypothetical protein